MDVGRLREHSRVLGFTPQDEVRWLAPGELVRTAIKVGPLLAVRRLRRPPRGAGRPARHDAALAPDADGGLWLDHVADLGDGFDPTYTVARLLAADTLEVGPPEGQPGEQPGPPLRLPRGRLLVLGGDEVYPTPSSSGYEDRMKGPYRAALPSGAVDPAPFMVALPGNHDWYDGLTAFLRLFAQRRPLGGWRTVQTRSYFARPAAAAVVARRRRHPARHVHRRPADALLPRARLRPAPARRRRRPGGPLADVGAHRRARPRRVQRAALLRARGRRELPRRRRRHDPADRRQGAVLGHRRPPPLRALRGGADAGRPRRPRARAASSSRAGSAAPTCSTPTGCPTRSSCPPRAAGWSTTPSQRASSCARRGRPRPARAGSSGGCSRARRAACHGATPASGGWSGGVHARAPARAALHARPGAGPQPHRASCGSRRPADVAWFAGQCLAWAGVLYVMLALRPLAGLHRPRAPSEVFWAGLAQLVVGLAGMVALVGRAVAHRPARLGGPGPRRVLRRSR